MKAITYVTVTITEMASTGDNVLLITLADPDMWELPAAEAGDHIVLYLGNGMRRTYSLCGDPADRYRYQVAVKLEKTGRGGSAWIDHQLRPGFVLGISLPHRGMSLQDKPRHVLLAGGIGITPMLSLIYTLERQHKYYELHYFYRGNPPLYSQVKQAARSGKVCFYPADRLPRQQLKEILPAYHEDYCLYCCGPDRMMKAFLEAGEAWQPDQLQYEHFSGVVVDNALFPSYSIELRRSDKTVWVEAGQSPLQALLEAGVDIDHACEGGICGACAVPWCEGKPLHRDKVLTEEERRHSVILCVAGCESKKMVLDI